MSLGDPIGDMLTRIRNGQMRSLNKIEIPFSNFRSKILEVVNNLFLGVKDIKLLKIEKFIQNQFLKNEKEAQKSQFFYDVYQSAPRLFIEIMIVLVIFAVAIKFNFVKSDNNKL